MLCENNVIDWPSNNEKVSYIKSFDAKHYSVQYTLYSTGTHVRIWDVQCCTSQQARSWQDRGCRVCIADSTALWSNCNVISSYRIISGMRHTVCTWGNVLQYELLYELHTTLFVGIGPNLNLAISHGFRLLKDTPSSHIALPLLIKLMVGWRRF